MSACLLCADAEAPPNPSAAADGNAAVQEQIERLQQLRAAEKARLAKEKESILEQERKRQEELRRVHETLKKASGGAGFTDADFD